MQGYIVAVNFSTPQTYHGTLKLCLSDANYASDDDNACTCFYQISHELVYTSRPNHPIYQELAHYEATEQQYREN